MDRMSETIDLKFVAHPETLHKEPYLQGLYTHQSLKIRLLKASQTEHLKQELPQITPEKIIQPPKGQSGT